VDRHAIRDQIAIYPTKTEQKINDLGTPVTAVHVGLGELLPHSFLISPHLAIKPPRSPETLSIPFTRVSRRTPSSDIFG
jgi:hypothetical protein